MEEKNTGDMEKILRQIGAKLDQLIGESKYASKDFREEIEKSIQDLKIQKSKIEAELRGFVKENDHKFKEVEFRLQNAADELRKAVDAIFNKKQDV